MMIRRSLFWFMVGFGLFQCREAFTDELRPWVVEITEFRSHSFRISWIVPPSLAGLQRPSMVMPERCAGAEALYRCAGGLEGETLSIAYPEAMSPVPIVIRLQYFSGEVLSNYLAPPLHEWRVPASENAALVARDYSWLGAEHILTSYDHLLFVLMLIFIAGTVPRILITITGFTSAHSITLALSTLGWISVPAAPVEACIALSILFLAREVAVRRTDTLTWRYPALIASVFGLLHGLGFATALAEIGLPQRQLALSLFSFNLGVELGQIAFILLMLALLRAFASMPIRWPTPIARLPIYATGAFSAFWLLRSVSG